MPWSDPALLFACVFAIASLILTGGAYLYGRRARLVDEPGDRRSHTQATVRGGGIGIVITLGLVMLVLRRFIFDPPFMAFAIGFALVAGIGWVDDHRPLSARIRLAVHVLASLIFAIGLAMTITNPTVAIASGVVAFALCLVLTNVWNFMDGINGIAASCAVLAVVPAALLAGDYWSPLAIGLAAACIGFLPWNFPRARLFMGDVGSGALGFAVGALSMATILQLPVPAAQQGLAAESPLFWLARNTILVSLAFAPFLVDASLTLGRRILRRETWWMPHVQHSYQVAAQRFGHPKVTLMYVLLAAVGTVGTLLLTWREEKVSLYSALVWYICVVSIWLVPQRRWVKQ